MSTQAIDDLRFAKVSPHAIQRFRERTGCVQSNAKIERRLRRLLTCGQEVKLKSEFRLNALLNHGAREARYFKREQFIIVLEGDVLKTIHFGTADRWEAM